MLTDAFAADLAHVLPTIRADLSLDRLLDRWRHVGFAGALAQPGDATALRLRSASRRRPVQPDRPICGGHDQFNWLDTNVVIGPSRHTAAGSGQIAMSPRWAGSIPFASVSVLSGNFTFCEDSRLGRFAIATKGPWLKEPSLAGMDRRTARLPGSKVASWRSTSASRNVVRASTCPIRSSERDAPDRQRLALAHGLTDGDAATPRILQPAGVALLNPWVSIASI